jgi:hypothetical protein
MKAIDKGYYFPVLLGAFGGFFAFMVMFDLRTGAIWRGGPQPTILLEKNAAEFYLAVIAFSALALTFIGAATWTLSLLFSRRRRDA